MRKTLPRWLLLPLCLTHAAAQATAYSTLLAADAALSKAVYDEGARTAIPRALGSDGLLLWPGAAIMTDSATVRRFFARQPLLEAAKLSWQPFRLDLSDDSALGLVSGVAVFDRPETAPIPAIHRIGRYMAVWRRDGQAWRLVALNLVNLIATTETIWNDVIGPREVPRATISGVFAPFLAADSGFAAATRLSSPAVAARRWAAPDAMTFAFSGELIWGAERIAELQQDNTAKRDWWPAAAGASGDGMLGWTAGQATTTRTAGGTPSRSKYLIFWRRQPDGAIRFISQGGNGRP